MRLWAILFLAVLAALLAGVLFAGIAAADTPQGVTVQQWYDYVCGNDGAIFKFLANYVMYPAFFIVVTTWTANSAWVQKNPVLGPLARVVGGHWSGWLRDAVKSAAAKAVVMLVVMVALAACSTATPQQQLLVDQGACVAQAIANAETAGLSQQGNAVGAAATSGVSTVAGYYCMQLTQPQTAAAAPPAATPAASATPAK